ncbi:MAG TPA: signal peptidase II [Sandaracinaceae bacterium LLY-WYZ-13_1]|nr:signal peptidase II [Sandaracinaceae bacterium LLY-WYZ-13_1]
MTRRSNQAIAICAAATLALVAADLGSKEWASANLSSERARQAPPVCGGQGMQRIRGESLVLVEGYLELSYAENCGAAFGLLRDAPDWVRRSIFGLAALAASVVLFVMFVQGRGGGFFAWSVPLIVSGAVGNLADRVRYGYVVDFIRFHLQDQWEYPTFNVADITITVGVALLIIDGFRQEKQGAEEERAREAAEAAEAGPPDDDEGPSPARRKKKRKKKAPAS